MSADPITPEEWSRRLRLLLQEEAEAAHAVAAWAVALDVLGLTSTPGSFHALNRYRSATDARTAFLRACSFP